MEPKLLVIGAGGHARSVLDIAMQSNQFSAIACTDAGYPNLQAVDGFPDVSVIGSDEYLDSLKRQGYTHAFVALGNNSLREKVYNTVVSIGFDRPNIVSPYAVISPRAHLGDGICIMAGAVINVNTTIGSNSIINTKCSIDHDCSIGQSCHIAPGATLSGRVCVGNGTQLGTGSSVIDGISIGEWSMVGAGSAVVKDLASYGLYYGVPACRINDFKR